MNAVPPSLTPGTTLSMWSALHDAAAVLAVLADAELSAADLDPEAVVEGPAWRRDLFDRTAQDATAALQPGIAGLAALAGRGVDSQAAARALWSQFLASRNALLALARQSEGSAREA